MQQADCVPGIPLPPSSVESQFIQWLNDQYNGLIPVLVTGCNDPASGRMNPSQTESLSLIMEEISKSECLKNNMLMVTASAHGRAPPNKFELTQHLCGHVADNYPQELGFREAKKNGLKTVMFCFDKKYRGDKWSWKMGKKDIYAGIYPKGKEGILYDSETNEAFQLTNPKQFEVYPNSDIVIIQTPGSNVIDEGKEPLEWQGWKSIPLCALVCAGMGRASQLATRRDVPSNTTKSIPNDTQLLLENKPHKQNALFVFELGGYSVVNLKNKMSPEELLSYKPPSVANDLWEMIVNKNNETVDIALYAKCIVQAMEQMVMSQLKSNL